MGQIAAYRSTGLMPVLLRAKRCQVFLAPLHYVRARQAQRLPVYGSVTLVGKRPRNAVNRANTQTVPDPGEEPR